MCIKKFQKKSNVLKSEEERENVRMPTENELQ